jgi:AAA domain
MSNKKAKELPWLKLLTYGDFGVGKTTLAASAVDVPQMRDVLLVNAEAGDLSVAAGDDDHEYELIDKVRILNYRTACRVYDYLKLHCELREQGDIERLRKNEAWLKGVDAEEIGEPRQYRTCIIDSLTELEAMCMSSILGVKENANLDAEYAGAEWGEFKKQHIMIQRLIRAFRDLPMHVVFICSRNFIQDEQKRRNFMPAMTGKLASQVQGFMDIVGFLTQEVGGDERSSITRKLWVQPSGPFAAKCRFAKYRKPYFENPSMGSILKSVGILAGD